MMLRTYSTWTHHNHQSWAISVGPIITVGCISLYQRVVWSQKLQSRLKNKSLVFWKNKTKNKGESAGTQHQRRRNVCVCMCVTNNNKKNLKERERWGRVRRRKHKSVALLGWMLTPVRDYWGEEQGHMAAWQSGTHGEAAGTLACMGPSIASSALRFVGRTGTLTMTSGSPTSVMAPGSLMTLLARSQEEGEKITYPSPPPCKQRVTYATR